MNFCNVPFEACGQGDPMPPGDSLPASADDQFNAKPIYKSFKGWKSSTVGIKNFEQLPENAKIYIKELEKFIKKKN